VIGPPSQVRAWTLLHANDWWGGAEYGIAIERSTCRDIFAQTDYSHMLTDNSTLPELQGHIMTAVLRLTTTRISSQIPQSQLDKKGSSVGCSAGLARDFLLLYCNSLGERQAYVRLATQQERISFVQRAQHHLKTDSTTRAKLMYSIFTSITLDGPKNCLDRPSISAQLLEYITYLSPVG
jgi:hypothetical protein